MVETVAAFYDRVVTNSKPSEIELVSLFAYYLTGIANKVAALKIDIEECFTACDLLIPRSTAVYLSRGLKGKPPKYVKVISGGYRLQRHLSSELNAKYGILTSKVALNHELRKLEASFSDIQQKNFLAETITCFEAGAKRAAIIMCWVMTTDHLFKFIYKNRLSDFNLALAKNPAGKLIAVVSRDDFGEMKEVKFIEVCRAAGIISNDQRKILNVSLGIRNSCAHPSSIAIAETKVVATIEDLILNIIQKF